MSCNTAYAPFQEISLNNLKDIEVKHNVFNTFVHYYQCCYLTYSAPFSISKNAWNCLNDLSMLSRTLSSKKSCLETTKRNSTTYLSNRLFKEIVPQQYRPILFEMLFFFLDAKWDFPTQATFETYEYFCALAESVEGAVDF